MRRIAFAAFAVASIAFPSVVYAAQLGATSDDTLYWKGGTSGTWDSTTANWLDASGAATAWVAGATACFTNDATATVAIAAGGVSASCIQAHGHPLTFTGGTLTMVGSSELVMRTGLVRFECSIAGSGGLHVTNGLYTSLLPDATELPANAVKFIENASLDGVSSLYATPGGWIAAAYSTDVRSYFLVNDGQTLTAQMQCFDNGNPAYTKCVFVELTQSGSDIYAKVKNTGVSSGDIRGTDFGTVSAWNDYYIGRYKLYKLRLGARVELAGANTFTGSLSADGATTIALVDGGTLAGGIFAGEVSLPNNSTLEIAHTRQKFSGNVVATGDTACSLVVKGTIDPSKNGTRTYTGAICDTYFDGKTYFGINTLFPGADANEISGWIGAEAYFKDSVTTTEKMGNAAGGKAETFYFWNDGMTVTAQFKIADYTDQPIGANQTYYTWHYPYVYGTIYEFSHNGSGIVAKCVRSANNEKLTDFRHPVDFMGKDISTMGYGSQGYRCKDLTVVVSNVSDTAVTLAGSGNTFGKGYITVDGAVLGIASANLTAPAYYNSVNVKNKGKLFFTGTSGVLAGAKATVDNESRLAFCRPGSLVSTATLVSKNGSEIVVEGGSATNRTLRTAANCNYCPILTLNGGTTLSGGPFVVGSSTRTFTLSSADGSGAVRIAQPFYISGTTEFQFAVPDLSGDDGADLLIDGQLRVDGVGSAPRPLWKSGQGTLRLGASNKRTDALYKDANDITQFGNPEAWTGVFRVTWGTLQCGADDALDGMSGIVIGASSLDVAGTKTATGTLQLTGDTAIKLGDGGEISFADSSAVAWTSGVKLAITGTGKVRFGGSASALTPAQLSAITLNGKNVKLSSAGYLRLPGLAIMIK